MPTVTIGANTTDTYSGFADNKLKENAPTTNEGSTNNIEVTKYSGGDWTTGLVKASGISSIPAGSIITATSLFLYQYLADFANGTYVVAAKRCLRNWVEAESTWNIYSTGNSWTTGGAFGNGTDRDTAATFVSAGLDLSTGAYKELVGNVDAIYDVQRMLDGAIPNYGWMLERTDASNDFGFRVFRSSEGTDGQRPYLSVTYTTPAAGHPAQIRTRGTPGMSARQRIGRGW